MPDGGPAVSLDLYLEADDVLTVAVPERALEMAGADEINTDGQAIEALFESGLTFSTSASNDQAIYAEETKGATFLVALRCYIRIKGPAPEGSSPLDDLERIARSIAEVCLSHFLISFQFEQTLYWRDENGLHCSE